MSVRPKENESSKKNFVEDIVVPSSRSAKVNLTDLVQRLKQEKKIERKNNILISYLGLYLLYSFKAHILS